MTHLYLIRHGETVWNKEGKFCGFSDIELTELGIFQTEKIVKRFKTIKIDKIYSSDLKRSLYLGKQLAKTYNLEVSTTTMLREINFGEWEGLNFTDIKEKFKININRWEESIKYEIPKGENIFQFQNRVLIFLDKVLKENKNKTIVLACHGGPIKIILLKALKIDISDFWRIKICHGAISSIIYENGRSIINFLNDTCHLNA